MNKRNQRRAKEIKQMFRWQTKKRPECYHKTIFSLKGENSKNETGTG